MSWRGAVDLQSRQRQMRSALDEAIAGLTEPEADALVVASGRSVREMLAHLTLTERSVLRDLQLMLAIDQPELPSIRRLDDPARLRDVIDETGTLAGLLAALDAAGRATLAFVESLSDDEEARVGHSADLGNVTAGSHAALNVTYHYLGHIEELRALRRRLSASA
jgi:hypothetical protein